MYRDPTDPAVDPQKAKKDILLRTQDDIAKRQQANKELIANKPIPKTPPNMRIYSSLEVNKAMPRKEGYRLIDRDWGAAMVRQFNVPNESYFASDPKRLAKYYNFLQSAPPGWRPPDWMNPGKIVQAYNVMQGLTGQDWAEWEPLDPMDPISIMLATIPDPPKEFMLPGEINPQKELINKLYEKDEQDYSAFMEIGAWEDLEPWQQFMMTVFNPQPITGRPEASRITAGAIKGAQASLAGLAVGGMFGKVTGMIGATAGTAIMPGVGTAIGYGLGLALGLGTYHQVMTGEKVPVINDFLNFFDLLAQGVERVAGMGVQLEYAGGLQSKEAQEIFENLPQAWKAAELTYEALPVGTWLTNAVSVAAHGINPEWSTGQVADTDIGEVWYLEKALAEPMLAKGGIISGTLLDETRSRLIAGENPEMVYADVVDRMGFSGTFGDFVIQSLADPLQYAPYVVDTVGIKVGDTIRARSTNPQTQLTAARISESFSRVRGNVMIDALPIGMQQLATIITKAKGSGGIFDAMGVYKILTRNNWMPKDFTITKTIPQPITLAVKAPASFADAGIQFDKIMAEGPGDVDGIGRMFSGYIESELTQGGVDITNPKYQAYIKQAELDIPRIYLETVAESYNMDGEAFKVTFDNALKNYFGDQFGWMNAGVKNVEVPYTPPLSAFDKWSAGLTEEGAFAELQPSQIDPDTPRYKKYWKYLTELTPEAQAAALLDLAVNNTLVVAQMTDNNPAGMIDMIKQIGRVDPVIAGQIGEHMLNSPAAATVAPLFKSFIDTGIADQALANWEATANPRTQLLNISEVLGETPGKMLDLIADNPDAVIQRMFTKASELSDPISKSMVESIQSGALDADGLKRAMAPYLGKNPVPWHPDAFAAELSVELTKFADKWLVDRYNIKPDPWWVRLSNASKAYQSLLVLGFNPLYAVNNWVNNTATNAVQGVYGLMTPGQIDTIWQRMGVKPAALEQGFGLTSDIRGDTSSYMPTNILSARDPGDVISKIHRIGKDVSKLGIFSTLSGKIEIAQGRQAITIGALQMFTKTWKEGVGFERLPANVEAQLRTFSPGTPEMIYSLVRSGMNMNEITTRLYGESFIRGVDGILDDAASRVYPNSPDLGRDLVNTLGIKTVLEDMLTNAKTIDDVDRVYDFVNTKAQEMIDKKWANDMVIKAESTRNIVEAEGLVGAMPLLADIEEHSAQRLIYNQIENEITALRADQWRAEKRPDKASQLWVIRKAEQDAGWRRFNADELQTMKGVMDATGLDSPDTQSYINLMSDLFDTRRKFFSDENVLLDKYFTSEVQGEARASLWDNTQKQISELYKNMTAKENDVNTKMYAVLDKINQETSKRPAGEIIAWGNEALRIRDRIVSETIKFREGLANSNLSIEETRAAFSTFNMEVLQPLILERRAVMVESAKKIRQVVDVRPVVDTPEADVPRSTVRDVDTRAEAERAAINAQRINTEADATLNQVTKYADMLMTKDTLKNHLRLDFNLTKDQTAAVIALIDAHAEVWGNKNNRNAADWYSEKLATVIKDGMSIEDINNAIDADLPQRAKGSVNFLEDGRAIINAIQGADIATVVHELGHIFRRDLNSSDLDTMAKWSGLKDGAELSRLETEFYSKTISEADRTKYISAEEMFADGFERYMAENLAADVAPPKMIRVFQQFKDWMRAIYKSIAGSEIDVEISSEMKDVYNRVLLDDTAIETRKTSAERIKHRPTGGETTAIGVDMPGRFTMEYKLVDARDLITSHLLDRSLNPVFPQELQGRFRDRVASWSAIIERAQNLNPDKLLIDTRQTDTGPMVILSDGTVISGNGRVLTLLMAIRDYPDNFTKYNSELSGYLDLYGFKDADIEGIEYPVIVRQLTDDVDLIKFADDANLDRIETKSTPEMAYADVKKWDPKILAELNVARTQDIDAVIRSNKNETIFQSFLDRVSPDDKNAMIAADGGYSKDGIARIKASLLASIFGESDQGKMLISLFYESTDPIFNNIKTAIENSLGELVKLEAKVQAEQTLPEMSFAQDVADVIAANISIKNKFGTFEEFKTHWQNAETVFGDAYVNIGLYDIDTPGEVKAYKQDLLHFFSENMRKNKPQTEFMKRYVERVMAEPGYSPGQLEMIPAERTSKPDMAGRIFQDLVNEGETQPFRNYDKDIPTLYQARAVGEVPVAGTPQNLMEGDLLNEVNMTLLHQLLDEMRDLTKNDIQNNRPFRFGEMPEELGAEVRKWAEGLSEDLTTTKNISMEYGTFQRNRAMLDYRKRYGIDNILGVIFPYQFWFTRSMGEWAKRAIDHPAWIATYVRYRKMQEKLEQYGIPTRLKEKMRMPAPWLPDWMGSGLYVNPMRAIHPYEHFFSGLELLERSSENVEQTAVNRIRELQKESLITETQAKQAIETRQGNIWEQAIAEAQTELKDKELDPMNMTSMMMTPAMWWTYPYHIMKGTADQLNPLPLTRTGQAIRSWGDGEGVLGFLGNILAAPEESLRRKFNLNTYGYWGEYYLDRMLSNMAGDNTYSTDEVLLAMMERRGPVYDEAVRRVEEELSLRMPGSQTALAIKEGRYGAIPATLLTTLFPAGILPEGELKLRGLKKEYNAAWDRYNAGDLDAVNEFFETYPEYQSRLALFDEPEERLREFLVDQIWENYFELDSMNKREAADQLGAPFKRMMLDKETRDYSAIDVETLAYWSQLLGGQVPDVQDTQTITSMPLHMQQELRLYRPEVVQEVETFWQLRDEKYPDYKELNSIYWDLPEEPKNIRKDFLKDYPELKEAWEWRKDYYKQHPLVKEWADEQSRKAEMGGGQNLYTTIPDMITPDQQITRDYAMSMEEALKLQLMLAKYLGLKVTGGAKATLQHDWNLLGQPAGDFDTWVQSVMDN